jgi:hypothetical protein
MQPIYFLGGQLSYKVLRSRLLNMSYSCFTWGKGLAQKIQQLQNKAARIINGSDYNTRLQEVLSDLNKLNLEERRRQHFKRFVQNGTRNGIPENLSNKFTSVSFIHSYGLRGLEVKLFVTRPLTEAFKKSFG